MDMKRLAVLMILVSLFAVSAIPVYADDAPCEEAGTTHIWISPLNPKADAPLKLIGVATDGVVTELDMTDSRGQRIPLPTRPHGGPPWSLSAGIPGLSAGRYRIEALRDGQVLACQWLNIGTPQSHEPLTWDTATEAFYSAWIETLFDAPPEASLSFPSLEPVLRDPQRNFLHNYLGANEDQNLPSTPDCADLPYTLRAYFAWKTGLPIAYRACSRGSASAPPRCGTATIKTDFTHGSASQASFRNVYGLLANAIHSGSARTGLDDESTDLYPVALKRENLWPGTVYADPYGHVLMLAQWIPQTANRPGILLAVDAQPDNSVTRKRFWEGTFLFANVASAGPGFKAFRPLQRTAAGGLKALSNHDLEGNAEYAPFSLEQDDLSPEDFYAKLTQLINPKGLEPKQAYDATLDALVEQLETRITSVNNGEAYFKKSSGSVITMPAGAAIFETIGPWEDYSTPSRDMRLIIAINVLTSLPDKIVRHPELFVLNGLSAQDAKAEIEQYHAQKILERKIHYTRSDGSPWELTVADVLARKSLYEMTYNPNDCVEMRWGAKPGTEEYATCHRHAPEAQHAKMEEYRVWFREARRPTR
jgi:hypothetical protein